MKHEELYTDLYVWLGKTIKEYRERANINQELLAEELDLSRSTLIAIEQGKQIPIHLLLQIMNILSIPKKNIFDKFDNILNDQKGVVKIIIKIPESVKEKSKIEDFLNEHKKYLNDEL